jgi:xanthine phosphoribosyltransferase
MKELDEKIMTEGQNLGNGILKIDSFLNHQIDAILMEKVGKEIANLFEETGPTLILTAEVSGIIPAVMVAKALNNLPVVYARKHKPITMREPVFVETAPSHTKGHEVNLMVSPEFLTREHRVLIVDDFLASGNTIEALARIVNNSGAMLVGIASVVEKSFEGGRKALAHWGVPVRSVAVVTDMSEGNIVVGEENPGA